MAIVLVEAVAVIVPIEKATHMTIGKIPPKAMISGSIVLAGGKSSALGTNLVLKIIMDASGSRSTLDYDRFMKNLEDLRICMSMHLLTMLLVIVFLMAMAMREVLIAVMVMMTMLTVDMAVVSHILTRYGRFCFWIRESDRLEIFLMETSLDQIFSLSLQTFEDLFPPIISLIIFLSSENQVCSV